MISCWIKQLLICCFYLRNIQTEYNVIANSNGKQNKKENFYLLEHQEHKVCLSMEQCSSENSKIHKK